MKKVHFSKSYLFLASAALGLAIGVQQTNAATTTTDPTMPIQILGFNDFHGYLNTTGKAALPTGTVNNAGTGALLAGYFDKYTADFKAKNPTGTTLKVESGDMIGASPADSALLNDIPTYQMLNAMGINVGTLGNHNFDQGLGHDNQLFLGKIPAGSSKTVQSYAAKYSQAQRAGNFKLVIGNVVDKTTGKVPYGYQPYTVQTVTDGQGHTGKIGFIGVLTTDTQFSVLPQNVSSYKFLDPATVIAKYSKALQAQGVKAIVVLAHTGSDETTKNGVDGESANIISKLNKIDPSNSVDAYMAGHSHTYTNGVIGKTRVVQALSYGKAFDDVTGTYDFTTNDFTATPAATIVPVDPAKGVKPDAKVAKIVAAADKVTGPVVNTVIGHAATAGNMSRTPNSLGESGLGDLITKADLTMANKAGLAADFALTNDGGIRTDLVVGPKNTITWGAVEAVQPFGNVMQVVKMTGSQIQKVLNQQTFGTQATGGKAFFLQAAGLKYSVVRNPNKADKAHPYLVSKMTKQDGTPIAAKQTYKVVINNYLYEGGDGFTGFENLPLTGAMDTDTNTFVSYIQSLQKAGQTILAPNLGLKTLVNN